MLARMAVILFIVYASLFGGVVETTPIVKLIHQVGSALIIALWLVSLRVRHRTFPVTRLDWPLFALGGGWLLSALLGENPRVSFELVWSTFFHIMLFFIFMDVIQHGRRRWLIEGLFFTGGIIIILGTVEMAAWYFGNPMLPGSGQGWPEIGGYTIPPVIHELSLPLNHNNPTGAYAVILIPLALAWSNTTRQTDLKWGLRILAAGLLGVVLLTQSRGAYLALVALVGFMALIWLLRPDVRARFPRRWQPSPYVVLAAAALGGIAAFFVLYRIVIEPNNPNPNDASRLDLWYSATQLFEEHPLTGIGPYQFKGVRLFYPHWQYSQNYLVLNHAHNILFNIVAEGGVLMLALSFWVVVRFGRIWWSAWKNASSITRRRIEGILAALLAFSVHNMVDAFIQTQFMIPLVVMAAYVTARDGEPAAESVTARFNLSPSKVRFGLAAAALVLGQIAFLPIHQGAMKHQRFSNLVSDENYLEALNVIRQAQDADPWLDLYVLEEAVILGQLAADEPEIYLTDAIRAFETSLERNAVWDVGWHNLAALYAQAGDYQHAIDAEKRAYRINPIHADYPFKLGEYYALAGDPENARLTYFALFEDHPWMASSGFWTDEEHPERTTFLDEAIEHYAGTAVGMDLLFYAGQYERLGDLTIPEDASDEMRQRWEALWPEGSNTPCLNCYHVRENAYLLEAESLLHAGSLTPDTVEQIDTLARKAVFLSSDDGEWGRYILARLSDDQVENDLKQAVSFPNDSRPKFDAIYYLRGNLEIIPQARVPRLDQFTYEPWIKLAEWEIEHGDREAASDTYEQILKADPYIQNLPVELAG